MNHITCPACSSKFTVKVADKAVSCPKCEESLTLVGDGSLPMIRRSLENSPKLLGSGPSWIEAEFEQLPPIAKQNWQPRPSVERETRISIAEHEFLPDLAGDEYQWEHDRQQRNRIVFASITIVGIIFVAGLGLLVPKAKSHAQNEQVGAPAEKKLFQNRPTDREPNEEKRQPLNDDGAIISRRPKEEPALEGAKPENKPKDVPTLVADKSRTKPRPSVSQAEIVQDQSVILQYVKVNILPKGIREAQWKGPWEGQRGDKKGKLYRLRGVATVLDDNFRHRDGLVAYYFFVRDERVATWQVEPKELAKVTICNVLNIEPLTPGSSDAESSPDATVEKR